MADDTLAQLKVKLKRGDPSGQGEATVVVVSVCRLSSQTHGF